MTVVVRLQNKTGPQADELVCMIRTKIYGAKLKTMDGQARIGVSMNEPVLYNKAFPKCLVISRFVIRQSIEQKNDIKNVHKCEKAFCKQLKTYQNFTICGSI